MTFKGSLKIVLDWHIRGKSFAVLRPKAKGYDLKRSSQSSRGLYLYNLQPGGWLDFRSFFLPVYTFLPFLIFTVASLSLTVRLSKLVSFRVLRPAIARLLDQTRVRFSVRAP